MNKLLSLMFVMLLLTLMGYGQKSFTKEKLQRKYEFYSESAFPVHKLSFDEWKAKNGYTESTQPGAMKNIIPPGTYLIKAKNHILYGFGCQIMAGGIFAVGTTSKDTRNAMYIGAGALSVIGFGFEISGILNIGKAGVSLNENGIGIKVKF